MIIIMHSHYILTLETLQISMGIGYIIQMQISTQEQYMIISVATNGLSSSIEIANRLVGNKGRKDIHNRNMLAKAEMYAVLVYLCYTCNTLLFPISLIQ